MRIKLNLMQLRPADESLSIYWLHIDLTCILFIKQLKEKIQKVLKEFRDIELCLDNVPFLDEDDIHVINENEEITVILKRKHHCSESKDLKTVTKEYETSISFSNNILYPDDVGSKPIIPNNSHEGSILDKVQKNSTKRIRKRTHKKKIQQAQPIENEYKDIQSETSVVSSKEPNKIHKRFKLDNSSDESIEIKPEVNHCDSSSISKFKNKTIQFDRNNCSKPKFIKVPVFVRRQTSTPENSTQNCSFTENDNKKSSSSDTSEDCDMLVVDWKGLSPVKVTNISELKIPDIIQFKTLSMNETGEPQMSSVITARLENIYQNTLHIQVLSGIKEFMVLNSKFNMDDEEEFIKTERDVEYYDLYEIFKLV